MPSPSSQLKLGIPKGSLEEATISLFDRAGWKIHKHVRNYFPDINDPDITARLCRVQEIPGYIRDGVLDLALTGKDWLLETGIPAEGLDSPDDGSAPARAGGPAGEAAPVRVVSHLIYSKVSNRPARWVLAVAGDSPYQTPADLAGRRVSTELAGVTRRYFDRLGIAVQINYSWGATEAKVVEGLADAIVEVTETETTIRAHGLRVIDEVLVSNTVLIASRAAWNDPVKRAKIEQIDLLLQGALRAESLVCVKMNAPAARLDAILDLLPALNSPTVAQLRDPAWLSLETVVDSGLVRDLIPRLRACGAEGILEYSLNKVI
ncbi:MAG: ATP phosphoribosyltransferase [Desulfovibrionaceae bacterium]|nr:ATP phosphoribosyltransferase [Desulfovibrionaceae bacterium]